MLICNVFKGEETYLYTVVEKLTLGQILSVVAAEGKLTNGLVNEAWMKEVSAMTYEQGVQEPLFRLFLLGDNTLTASFEHSAADGTVGVYIHQLLAENFENYDSDKYGELPEEITLDTQLFDFSVDKAYLRPTLVGAVDPYLEPYTNDFTYGDLNHYFKVPPPGFPEKFPGRSVGHFQDSIAFKLINLPIEDTKLILKKCKLESVTLTNYVSLVLAITFLPLFKGTYGTHKVAINLRRHCPDIDEPGRKVIATMANVGISHNIAPTTEFSWDNVRTLNAELLKTINNKRVLNVGAAALQYLDKDPLTNPLEAFTSQLGKPRADASKFSNLGYVDTPLIDNLVFSQDLPPTVSELMLNAVTTPKGGLNFVLSYFDDNFDDIEEDNFDGFVLRFRGNLLKFIE